MSKRVLFFVALAVLLAPMAAVHTQGQTPATHRRT